MLATPGSGVPGSVRDPSFEWPDLDDDDEDESGADVKDRSADREDDKRVGPARTSSSARSVASKAKFKRLTRLRRVQLGLACCMSVGSHFGAYLLGPVKQNLHTSEHGFASLVSSFQLVNTVTPLVSNAFVLRFGAPKTALGATGTVLLGQVIVVWAQRNGTEGDQALSGMILGLFCFGLGLAPIAVCQESIILKQNSSNSKTVARSVAVGLLFGKTAAFFAACTAEPMAAVSPRLPFIVAMCIAFFSFACCIIYNHIDKSLPPLETEDESGHTAAATAGFSVDKLLESKSFGDPFWLYAVVCTLAGAWYSTIHLSSSMIQATYSVSEARASAAASVILFSSSVLYPIIGTLVDMRPHVLRNLYFAVPIAILGSYISMLYLTWLVPWWLAAVPAAIGIGSGPLLLVVVVPRLVERAHAPTALSIHKSVEMSGAVLCQTLTGSILSSRTTTTSSSSTIDQLGYSRVLLVLALLVSIQLLVIVVWWWIVVPNRELEEENLRLEYALAPSLRRRGEEREPSDWDDDDDEEEEGDEMLTKQFDRGLKESRSSRETGRGLLMMRCAIGIVGLSWLSFVVSLGMA
ncbi:hypothetical protein ACM66B_001626 [Microbotryomycetes sp. NB124-2]